MYFATRRTSRSTGRCSTPRTSGAGTSRGYGPTPMGGGWSRERARDDAAAAGHHLGSSARLPAAGGECRGVHGAASGHRGRVEPAEPARLRGAAGGGAGGALRPDRDRPSVLRAGAGDGVPDGPAAAVSGGVLRHAGARERRAGDALLRLWRRDLGAADRRGGAGGELPAGSAGAARRGAADGGRGHRAGAEGAEGGEVAGDAVLPERRGLPGRDAVGEPRAADPGGSTTRCCRRTCSSRCSTISRR